MLQSETRRAEAIAVQALLSGVTEMTARAGHDLLGPLNQAGSLLALFVARHRNQTDADGDALLELLQRSSVRMGDVVGGVRKFLEVAGRLPELGRVDLNDSLAFCLAGLEHEISRSGALIRSDSLPVVWADAAQMAAMFEILIGNSLRFRDPAIPPRIYISSVRTEELGGVAITDNGIGIDPEYRESALLPFMRLNGAKYAGAGLGLATAKLIAGMHGGRLVIDSPSEPLHDTKNSRGTCVRFAVRLGGCGVIASGSAQISERYDDRLPSIHRTPR